ncbi:nitrogen fixation protein NifZ [Methylophilus sp. 3sh_L]|uniref:nitrogen fixation protein NifZ n=1 Tax=Methylophilus sp. 3sh_L TaxID=3377114 RepID=UPI00398ECCD5
MATNIVRDSDVVELVNPPRFDYGQKVRSKKYVRNDGTFPGKEVGEILVKKGDVGYVTSIGTFLQQFYIYGVDFYELGYRVGMRGKELEADEPEDEGDLASEQTGITTAQAEEA